MTHLFPPDFAYIDLLSQAYLIKNPHDINFRNYRLKIMTAIDNHPNSTLELNIDEIAWVRHLLEYNDPINYYEKYITKGGMDALFVFYYLCERFLVYKQDVLKKMPTEKEVKDAAKNIANEIFNKLGGK